MLGGQGGWTNRKESLIDVLVSYMFSTLFTIPVWPKCNVISKKIPMLYPVSLLVLKLGTGSSPASRQEGIGVSASLEALQTQQ